MKKNHVRNYKKIAHICHLLYYDEDDGYNDDDDSEDDEQTTEEKDHLVAELYKHMEDKGSPINHTPAINGKGRQISFINITFQE